MSYKILCAQRRLISAYAFTHSKQNLYLLSTESFDVWLPIESEGMTGPPSHLRRLIRVIACRTCDLVGNAVARLKCSDRCFSIIKSSDTTTYREEPINRITWTRRLVFFFAVRISYKDPFSAYAYAVRSVDQL